MRGHGTALFNDCGQEFPSDQSRDIRYATAARLRLHHYFTRSYEELQNKISKGRVSKAGQVKNNAIDRRLRQFALATETDTTIIRFVPKLQERLMRRYETHKERAQ